MGLACLVGAPGLGLAAGCGTANGPPPAACLQGPAAIARALARAPAPVTLAGGERLSQCVDRARSDGDLQSVGAVLTQTADALQRQAQAPGLGLRSRAALELGYLIGAIERGGQHTAGLTAELVRRVEQDAGVLDAAPATVIQALRAGLAAGRATG